MTEQFKILTPQMHVRKRPNMYVGATMKYTTSRFVKGSWHEVTYVPAIFKMINEVLDNSVDEAIRTNFKYANKISVSISADDDSVTVTDNGRGIPQDEVIDPSTGDKILRPVAAWTRVNAGTSFTDDRVSIGANGVGSSATNFLSSKFIGQTWQKGKMVTVSCSDGANEIDVSAVSKTGNGTKVTFSPDFSLFESDHIDDHNMLDLVEDRLINLKMAFPEIEFRFNGKEVGFKNFKDYAKQYGECVIEDTKTHHFIVGSSEDGFRHNSFVNGVNTSLGGAYIDFIANGLVECLVPMIKKKFKVDVSKTSVKNNLAVISFARDFKDPKFDSQTKERLTSSAGKIKDHYVASGCKPIEDVAKRILATPEIINPIVEAELAKQLANERRAATLAAKKAKKVRVAKHVAATGSDATLHLVEGDSALSSALVARDPKKHGFFPLRGVVKNTWSLKANQVYENKELFELVSILGLDCTDCNSWKSMSYDSVTIMADADVDGQKISTMLVAFFARFWPDMIEAKKVRIMRTPVLISKKGADVKWFYNMEEAIKFKQDKSAYEHRYIKGLGSLESEEYRKILNTPVLDVIEMDGKSEEMLEMMFGVSSEPRKKFMYQGETE